MATALTRLVIPVLCVCIAGCGGSSGFPKTYPVTGKVTMNGKAIEGAMVTFKLEEGKENAIGTTDSKGEFTLSMFQPGDGAVPGAYRITVTKLPPGVTASASTPPPGQLGAADLPSDYAPPTPDTNKGGPAAPKSEIPAKYSNEQSSGLRATVVAGANNIPLDLK
ncbi:MAG: carboxypeptidase-like regulatory domain-containing protein [Pirellulales bacterium]